MGAMYSFLGFPFLPSLTTVNPLSLASSAISSSTPLAFQGVSSSPFLLAIQESFRAVSWTTRFSASRRISSHTVLYP